MVEPRKPFSFGLRPSIAKEIQRIADLERRSRSEVARLLLLAGLRAYKRGRPLLCGYPDCTRKDCCGGAGCRGKVLTFPPNTERGGN